MAAFREHEAIERGFEKARRYLVPRESTPAERKKALEVLHDLIDELGPVVDWYPSWHPLVGQHDPRSPVRTPSEQCGYKGLDHTVHFAHGFVTCPYHDAEQVISSVASINVPHGASLSAERIDAPLYNSGTQPVIVRCDWETPLELGKLVPKRVAVGLMLDQEIKNWHWTSLGESWETMRGYFLGEPHGARSSLFVSQDTAMAMKRIWLAIIESGVFGPVRH
ncbi:hypothetical protein D2T31_04735 [Sinirhodobacter populi]|uniref:Uncharacterized protein n=1 Tax=Paenirhodobacter populi TaxID=2306993 RepID=A0A443KEN7_9RHOB|nr:hypothetical protein [Sinirhodobacter populi]RWR31311.1 hypothetical protein D2T31_04735 [Sinirhodobacter populi]